MPFFDTHMLSMLQNIPKTSLWSVFRAAASDAYSDSLDYTVLSVAVITLGLILVVELVRHRLDVKATGRPFFKSVLEGVYRELATLGIVEFFIFLLHKYYKDLNIAQEQVFADIHFTLFFTAVFNALQSVLMAVTTTHVSHNMWVRTEQLEVDHYVEIREEFERVETLLYGEGNESNDTNNDALHRSLHGSRRNSFTDVDIEMTEVAFDCSCQTLARNVQGAWKFVRYPHLYRKHRRLLVQIRFHELRVHFLQSNDLPLKFKVSDYLKRCELSLLIKMVHITTFAWLLLTGGVALVYFLMGIVVYVTDGDLERVGTSLTYILVLSMALFVVMSLIIFNKMKLIFSTIMRKRFTTETTTTRVATSRQEISSQQALFWGGNPKFIRVIVQFMQFGFAIALSILLVFWKDIDQQSAAMSPGAILGVVLGCYALFVIIMAQVLPRYTLCTSLGQMVDQRRLQETLAHYRLEEARRQQELQKKWEEYDDDDDSIVIYDESDDDDVSRASSRSSRSGSFRGLGAATFKAISGSFSRLGKTFEDVDFSHSDTASLSKSTEEEPPKSREQRVRERRARRKSMSEGVAVMRHLGLPGRAAAVEEKDTQAAQAPPADTDKSPDTGKSRGQRMRERRARRKSMSEGVALMRGHWGEKPLEKMRGHWGEKPLEKKEPPSQLPPSRQPRDRHLSGSDEIKKMKRSPSFETLLLTQLVQTETKELRKNLNVPDSRMQQQREDRIKARRRNRTRSMSDGVALMRHVMEEEEREEEEDSTSAAATTSVDSPKIAPDQPPTRHRRQRSASASASIQSMRDSMFTSSDESLPSTAKPPEVPSRRPRSRQSSSNVLRLEPLVEGVPADHSPPFSSVDHDHADTAVSAGLPTHVAAMSSTSDDKSTSTLGGHSDADDVPDVDPDVREHHVAEPKPRPSLPEIARAYFLSTKYRMISGVFGTLICFYLVGQRVESLMIETCTMPDYNNTWAINLSTAFWMETAWLSWFILTAGIIMLLFRPWQVFSNKERVAFLSAAFDIVLSSLCLILLMLAESRRCCPDDEARFLAEEPVEGAATAPYCELPSDCCPSYGKRWYGSLGNIEPFTALICLRILRFVLAEKVVFRLDKKFGWSTLDVPRKVTEPESLHPFSPMFSVRHARTIKSMEDEVGTTVELWKHALIMYPEVVKEYGEFSGELLQAMLGIEVVPGMSKMADASQADSSPVLSAESPPASPPITMIKKPDAATSRRTSVSIGKKFSHLPPEAQSIILSGKLGKSVHSMSVGGDGTSPTSVGRKGHPLMASDSVAPTRSQSPFGSKETPPKVKFELESVASGPTVTDETFTSFIAPNARLLRSMRRCDRKLLPLLDKWTVVDVVVTKWEIVYLEAIDVDGDGDDTDEDTRNVEAVRQAVVATKGGKGLRLRDVAMGRRVVGHLELSAVDDIHVERAMPTEDGDLPDEIDHDSEELQVEFWKNNSEEDAAARYPRTMRWSRVKQDRLKIHSMQGTLFLRFYSDLEDSECHVDRCTNERETEGPIFKDNAFQWCQTIVRLCGINQLKQKLPHFGDDDSEELRDYLEVVDPKVESPRHHRRKTSLGDFFGNMQRRMTLKDLSAIPEDSAEYDLSRPFSLDGSRRVSSFGEMSSNNNLNSRRPSRTLRRLSSTGDAPTGGDLDLNSLRDMGNSSNSKKKDAENDETGADFMV